MKLALLGRAMPYFLLLVCLASVVSACETAPVPNPVTPSPAVPPTTGFAISSLPGGLTVGQSAQLTASVVLPDGSRKFAYAKWESSDIAVATISTDGLLTIVGRGVADITAAAYQQQTSTRVRVPFVITGVVHETAPTETAPIAGARVIVQGGRDAGAAVSTDNAGQFTLEVEAAGFTLAVTREGYESRSTTIEQLPRDEHPSIGLLPDGAFVTTRFTGGICADLFHWLHVVPGSGPYTFCRQPFPLVGHHFLPVHRTGILEIDFGWGYREDYSAEFMGLEVACGTSVVEQYYALGNPYSEPTGPPVRLASGEMIPLGGPVLEPRILRVPIATPTICEIKPGRYRSFKGQVAATSYQITVTHPK